MLQKGKKFGAKTSPEELPFLKKKVDQNGLVSNYYCLLLFTSGDIPNAT